MARGQPQFKPDELPWIEQYLKTRCALIGDGIDALPDISYTRVEGDGEPAEACTLLHGSVRRCRIVSIRVVVAYEEEPLDTAISAEMMSL